MRLLAIDPGTKQSAYVVYENDTGTMESAGILPNLEILSLILTTEADRLIIEMIKSYGNVMGDSILHTCLWIGRFIQVWDKEYFLIARKTIVTELCMNPRAKDSNVRQALIDRWGGKVEAIGNKAKPGPLYSVKKDMWAALAVAVVASDLATRYKLETIGV